MVESTAIVGADGWSSGGSSPHLHGNDEGGGERETADDRESSHHLQRIAHTVAQLVAECWDGWAMSDDDGGRGRGRERK